MAFVLKFFIYGYRLFIRPFWKRTCIFKTSCSQEVLNELDKNGFRAGLNALEMRMKYCKPGFITAKHPNTRNLRIVFSDGKYLEQSEISSEILEKLRPSVETTNIAKQKCN